jgi:hypothetical protein
MDNANKIEGFDGRMLHPSLDMKDGILILGFRHRATVAEDRETFLLARNGNVEILHEASFEENGALYFIDLRKRKLAWLEERWGIAEVNQFLEDHATLANNPFPNHKQLFDEIVAILKRFMELETETDYVLVAAWVIGTYFHPLFPAYPYLHPKGPKHSGKSQLLTVLQQLSFNAIKARPSLAALCDTVDALRGTYLIDQADSLGRKGGEEMVDILTDSYKRSGGKRRIIEFDKNKKRSTVEYETYGPKALAGIRELPEDLRDRNLFIPIMRSKKGFLDPDNGGVMWKEMRGKLYRHLIDQYGNVDAEYLSMRIGYERNGIMIGRELELWLPLETMLRCAGHGDLVQETQARFLSWYSLAAYEPSEFEEAVVLAIREQFDLHGEDEMTIGTKEIVERMNPDVFRLNDTPEQRAVKVGWTIKKFNLASKRTRTGKCQSYCFRRENVEKVYQSYFSASEPTQPTQAAETPVMPALDDVQVPSVGDEVCRTDLHEGKPTPETYITKIL